MLVQQEGASVGIQMAADNAATIERNRTVAGHRIGAVLRTRRRPSPIQVLLLRHAVGARPVEGDGRELGFESSRRLLRDIEIEWRARDVCLHQWLGQAAAVITIGYGGIRSG